MDDVRMHVLRAAEAADISSPACMISLIYYSAGHANTTGLLDTRTTVPESLDGHRVLTNLPEAFSRSCESINRE